MWDSFEQICNEKWLNCSQFTLRGKEVTRNNSKIRVSNSSTELIKDNYSKVASTCGKTYHIMKLNQPNSSPFHNLHQTDIPAKGRSFFPVSRLATPRLPTLTFHGLYAFPSSNYCYTDDFTIQQHFPHVLLSIINSYTAFNYLCYLCSSCLFRLL